MKKVPKSAQKQIQAGRLKGMTDISPMWRIKMLTEIFGPAGIGWYTDVIRREIVDGPSGDKMAIMDIHLYVRENGEGEWSKPIFGTGGKALIAKENSGLRADDEAWKKTYTDALSVACKALGIGADIYWKGGELESMGSHNNTPTNSAAPKQEYPRPAVLDTAPNAVSQDELTACVKYYYAPLAGTEKAKVFIAKLEELIGNKNYMNVPDVGKRLALFNYIKEMIGNV